MESRPRLPRRLSLAGLLAVVVAFALPVALVLAAGAAPYEAIVRVFPGDAVAVTTTILQVIAELAGVVTVARWCSCCSCATQPPRRPFN